LRILIYGTSYQYALTLTLAKPHAVAPYLCVIFQRKPLYIFFYIGDFVK
jgi:hypothetical protein